MSHGNEPHHRRSIRLKGYDYTQPGAYFITLVTHQRACLFGDVQNGVLRHSPMGRVAEENWRTIPDHFPNVVLGAYVIMPNHVHGIIILNGDGRGTDGRGTVGRGTIYRAPTAPTELECIARPERSVPTTIEQFQKPVAGSIPTIIRTYKASVTPSYPKRNWWW